MYTPSNGIIVACCNDPRKKPLIRSAKCECHAQSRKPNKSKRSDGNYGSSSRQDVLETVDTESSLSRQMMKGRSFEDTDELWNEWNELIKTGSLKDSLDLGSNESKRRLRAFINSLPTCQDCGEKHPAIKDKGFVEKYHSLQKKLKQKNAANPADTKEKAGCQWPNPCPADCFEEHVRFRKETSKIE